MSRSAEEFQRLSSWKMTNSNAHRGSGGPRDELYLQSKVAHWNNYSALPPTIVSSSLVSSPLKSSQLLMTFLGPDYWAKERARTSNVKCTDLAGSNSAQKRRKRAADRYTLTRTVGPSPLQTLRRSVHRWGHKCLSQSITMRFQRVIHIKCLS